MFKAAPVTAARHSTAVPSTACDSTTAVPASRAATVKATTAVKSSSTATVGEGGSGSQRNTKNRSNVKAIEFWVHESSLWFRVGEIAARLG